MSAEAPRRAAGHVRAFVTGLAWRVPLGAVLGLSALVLPAGLWLRSADAGGTAAALGGWSLVAVYAVAGLVGGALLGGVGAVSRAWDGLEAELESWLATRTRQLDVRRMTPAEWRARGDEIVEQVLAGSIARLRLPSFLVRLVRSRLRRVLVVDFVEDCERRGVASVGLPEFASWLVLHGPATVTGPARAQLRLWRGVLLGGFVMLAAIPLGLLAIRTQAG